MASVPAGYEGVPTGYEPARRFRSAASHYLAGRPAYAGLLVRRVATLVGLGPGDRVLDLGCGPGVLARAFSTLAGEVVAMDPEPAMLHVAQAYCAELGNVRFVAGSSDDLTLALGRFRLVVMGRSFHWMDRAVTLRRLDSLVEPGGAVVLFHTGHAPVPVNAWTEHFHELRRRYRGDADEPVGPNAATSDQAVPIAAVRDRAGTHAAPADRAAPNAAAADRAGPNSAVADRAGPNAAAADQGGQHCGSGRRGWRSGASGGPWVRHEAFLLASPFCHVEGHSVYEEGQVDAARLIDRAFSMSGTAPEKLGARATELERDIADLVRDEAPHGRLTEVIESSALIARRPGEEVAP